MNVEPGIGIGDYLVREKISQGGFGVIWRAAHSLSGQVVAIKVLHADLVTSEDIVLRFEREAQTIAQIRHPNVVDLLDYGRLPDGRPYLVMEHLSGVDLDDYIYSRGPLPPLEAIAILEALGNALQTAHAAGIVHRDLKASNVVLSERDGRRRVVLLDFGIAKLLEDSGPQITGSQITIGSPVCMAPEQIRGEEVGPWTDVYGLGSLMFHMLTGSPPFSGSSLTSMDKHLFSERPRPSESIDVTPAYDEIVVRAMSQEPPDRYASVEAFVAAFRYASRPGNPSAPRTRERTPAVTCIGAYVDVRADEEAMDDPDDSLIDDVESVFPRAFEYLGKRGFLLAYESGNSALFVKPLSSYPGPEQDARQRAVDGAIVLFETLMRRVPRDPRVQISIHLHVGEARVTGTAVEGGPLLDLATWGIDGDVEGVVASSAFSCAPEALGPSGGPSGGSSGGPKGGSSGEPKAGPGDPADGDAAPSIVYGP